MAGSPSPVPERANAPQRILRAAARRIGETGALHVSLQEIADAARVSKGLIHYHFADKETLLARLVQWLTQGALARERGAIAGATAQTVIDRLWSWLADELARGDLRVIVELAHVRDEAVREAVRASAIARRHAAEATIDGVFAALELRPRIPTPLLADVAVTFIDGLAVDAAVHPDKEQRVAFDVFWLSILSLVE